MSVRSSGRVAAAMVIGLVVVLGVVPATAAAESRAGGTVVVAADETVDGLTAVGGTIVVRGTVNGNLEAVGGTVVVAESGAVTGDVAVSAGSVQIDGTVEGELNGAAGALTIGENATVGGSLQVGAGTVIVGGRIGGDATVGAERLVLRPTAVVDGDLTYDDDTELVREEGATVAGTVSQEDLDRGGGVGTFAGWVVLTAWELGANLLLGALLLLAFPRFSAGIADRIREDPLRTGGVGLLTLVAVPLVLVLLVLTIVGIPIALALGLPVLLIGGWVAFVYGQYAVGDWASSEFGGGSRWVALVVGVVGITLLSEIPIVGGLLDLVVFVLGLGALAATLYAALRRRRRQSPRAAERPGGADSRPA